MGKDGKPKGKMTAYAYFVQTCREEHKKKNPSEAVKFTEFSKKCGEKWKAMSDKEKKKFEDLATKDKARYDKEMANYVPAEGAGKRKKGKKDPNAPKRALSAFFCFCNEERAKVKAKSPNLSVSDVAKELGKRWEACANRTKYEELAAKDKQRYERELAAYKKGGSSSDASGSKKATGRPAGKPAAKKSKKQEEEEDEEDEEEEEEEEEDEDEDEEEESD